MKRLKVELENCYGIRALETEFDFSRQRAYAVYAPNGAVKSSLAQTFKDAAGSASSRDRVFPARVTKRSIKDENGAGLSGENVLVIRPYDEFFGHTEKTSTLLVDAKLRTEYEQLHADIDKAVRHSKPDSWVGNSIKEKKVRQAIAKELPADFDSIRFDELFELVKMRNEYH